MAKRTVKDLDVAGKRVIVRCDFNVPRKDGKITNDNRIIQALPTIKYLVENNAKIILMSHLGKVKTEEDKAKNDLRCVAERLNELVDTKVTFVPVTRGEELENAVAALNDGEIVVKHMFSNADVQGAHQHIVFIIIFMIGRCILFLEGIDYVLVLAHLLKAS